MVCNLHLIENLADETHCKVVIATYICMVHSFESDHATYEVVNTVVIIQ